MSEGRRFCENCGAAISQTANFCPNCGQDMNVGSQDQRIPTEDTDTGVLPPPSAQSPGTRGGGVFRFAVIGCGTLIGLVLLLVIIGALLGDRDTADVQKEEPAKEKKEEKKEEKEEEKAPAREPAAINLSGFGQAATESF